MTIALMKLLVWLLAALASLVFVFVLLLLFSVATIRRWRIVAPRIVLCDGDAPASAGDAAFATVAHWAQNAGFTVEAAVEQSSLLVGVPPLPGRVYRHADGFTRLLVFLPKARLIAPPQLISFVSWQDDQHYLETVGGTAHFRVLALPMIKLADVRSADLNVQWQHHRERIARTAVVSLPPIETHLARFADAYAQSVAQAQQTGRFAIDASGNIRPTWQEAWRITQRRMRGAQALAIHAQRKIGDEVTGWGRFRLRLGWAAVGYALALLTILLVLVVARGQMPAPFCALRSDWPQNVGDWQQRIRASASPEAAATDAVSAVQGYADTEEWPAVRQLLSVALPAVRNNALDAADRSRALAELGSVLAWTTDTQMQTLAWMLIAEALAACGAPQAAEPGCRSVPLLARARRALANEDPAVARADLEAALADARRAPDAYRAERVAAAGELARIETFAQRTDEAISLWQEVLTADADVGIQKVEGYVRLANLLRARGQRDDGVNTLRAMARAPWKPHFQADAMRAAYIELAWWGLEDGKPQDAAQALHLAIGSDTDPEWLVVQWLVARTAQDEVLAARALATLLELREQEKEYWSRQLMGLPRALPQHWVGMFNDLQQRRYCRVIAAIDEAAVNLQKSEPARADAARALVSPVRRSCASSAAVASELD